MSPESRRMAHLVLPIGSNNYTFPVLNCLFLIAPATIGCFLRAWRTASGQTEAVYHFAWISTFAALLVVLTVQGTAFHFRFSFRDGMDGEVRNTRIMDIPKLSGMITTGENATRLSGLYRFLQEGAFSGKEVIAFGDIPGISYLFDLPPALFTTWPDLESNVTERFDEALSGLATRPLVIIQPEGADNYAHSERKHTLLLFYMEQAGYETVYDADGLRVYAAPENAP